MLPVINLNLLGSLSSGLSNQSTATCFNQSYLNLSLAKPAPSTHDNANR